MAKPVNRQTIGAQVADHLRSDIIHSRLEDGLHLVEESLAADYEVSRGPIRDALAILGAEGLIKRRRAGYFVSALNRHDVEELYSLRVAMETLAFNLAIERTQRMDWTRAQAEVDAMCSAADDGDGHTFATHDLNFHGVYFELSGHSRLESLWMQYKPTFGAILDVNNEQEPNLHSTAHDHRVLLDDSMQGHVDKACSELVKHLNRSKTRMVANLGLS